MPPSQDHFLKGLLVECGIKNAVCWAPTDLASINKDPVIAWNFARSYLLAKSLSGLHSDVPNLKPRKETRHSSHGLDVTVLVVSALETGAIQVTYSVVLATGGQHPSFSRDQYWEPIGAQNWASDCPEVRLSRNGR
jgi:hypothetical protein